LLHQVFSGSQSPSEFRYRTTLLPRSDLHITPSSIPSYGARGIFDFTGPKDIGIAPRFHVSSQLQTKKYSVMRIMEISTRKMQMHASVKDYFILVTIAAEVHLIKALTTWLTLRFFKSV
jgi:hypothetical protein